MFEFLDWSAIGAALSCIPTVFGILIGIAISVFILRIIVGLL